MDTVTSDTHYVKSRDHGEDSKSRKRQFTPPSIYRGRRPNRPRRNLYEKYNNRPYKPRPWNEQRQELESRTQRLTPQSVHRGRGSNRSRYKFGGSYHYHPYGSRHSNERRQEWELTSIARGLKCLGEKNASEIVVALQDKNKIRKYMDVSFKHIDHLHILISVLEKAFTSKTTSGLILNVLNILREHEFIRTSLECLKTSFQDSSNGRADVIYSVRRLINILTWATMKNPSSLTFLHGSLAFLKNFIEGLDSYAEAEKEFDSIDDSTSEDSDHDGTTQQKTNLGVEDHDNSAYGNDKTANNVDNNSKNTFEIQSNNANSSNESASWSASEVISDRETNTLLNDCDTGKIDGTKTDEDGKNEKTSKEGLDSPECENDSCTVKDIESVARRTDDNSRGTITKGPPKIVDGCNPKLSDLISDLFIHLEHFMETLKKYHLKEETTTLSSDDLNEFREVPIFPCIEDINGTIKTKLRAIKVKGSYNNVSDYLDVHFRLLREDYIAPLREAVLSFMSPSVRKRKDMKDVMRYENVRILSPIFNDGFKHILEFDVSKLGKVRWNTSKRLKYGSLVCLSADYFRSCYFATISDSDVRKKRDGIIQVQFEKDIACVNGLMKLRFTMIESPAYFEAYRHVLSSLQKLTDEEFTMAKYIVFGNTKIEPPKYLRALEKTTCNSGFLKPHKEITYTIPCRQQLCDHIQDNVDQLQNIQQYSDPTVVKLEEISNANKEVAMEWTDTSSSAGKVEEERKNKLQLSHYVGLSNDESNISNRVVENGTDIVLNMHYKLLSDHTTAQSNKGDNVIDEHSTNYSDIVRSELKFTDHATDISKEESTSDNNKSMEIINTLQNKRPSYDQRHDLLENEFIDIDDPLILNTLQDEKEVLDDIKDPCEDKQIKEENQRMTFVKHLLDPCKVTSENDLEVDVLHGKWPGANELGLDSTQYDAFKAALTSEITLIQGPPGCGKTYVGLQIVKTLLKNKHVRHSGNPIMILCYTNHALDQFMTEIRNIYQGMIVRVGSRISTEKLKSISLPNLRQEFRKDKRFPLPIYHAARANRLVINDCEFTINLQSMKMDCLKRNIVCIESLKCVIESDFYKQFQWKMNTQHRRSIPPWLWYLGYDIIIEWLGIYDLAQEISNSTFRNTTNFQHIDDLTDESISCDHREVMTEKRLDVDENKYSQYMKDYRLKHLACDLDYIVSDIKNVPYHKEQMVRLERERLKKTIRLKLKSPFETPNETTDERITTDIFSEQFSREKRWTLYKKWVDKKCDSLMNDLSKSYDTYMMAYKRKSEIAMLEDDFILKKADVIGMTTTGAAKINNTLRENQPDIVIIEEAAEVLEGHIVSNLTAGCEHLILIGDHKQLKPKPEVYGLEINYNLNLSLFERLINNGIACHALQVQHRMRPEISANLRHIYKDLQDHKSVNRYECIKGVKHNAFFINHSVMESKPDELSYVNDHEALFLVRLCKHLLLQGYDERNITILTTYKGQMFKIKREMLTANIKEVLVTVVDNYQGEENDIILLSFVRSNESNRVGFVAKDNRVCVALSRAKKGLYAIGNFEQLSNSSSLWNSVVTTMKTKGLYGDKLPLMCQNHETDESMYAQVHTDFDNAPEGGCMKSCDARLDCGHVCTRRCHISDRYHKNFSCEKPCTRTCKNYHPCRKRCHEECYCEDKVKCTLPCGHIKYVTCEKLDEECALQCAEICSKKLPCGHTCLQMCAQNCKCLQMVQRKLSKCGHDVIVPCCVEPSTLKCNRNCGKTLPCGHSCHRRCGEKCSPCMHEVKILRPDCGHLSSIPCDIARNETHCMEQCGRTLTCGHKCKNVCSFKNEKNSTLGCPNGHHFECMEVCNYELKCGHGCMELCSTCTASGHHARCNKECKYNLICGHTAATSCEYIEPCDRICMRSCKHGRCEHICNCLCVSCKEPCSWQCEHYTCTKLCGEICDRPRCNLPCEKLLRCGHKCNGVCGDPCPVPCFECDHSSDNTTVVQLQDCGCILPITLMDRHMESGDSFVKTCPKCKTPILTTYGNRYEQLVNTGWKNMNELKANCKKLRSAALESFHVLNLWKDKHKVQFIFSHSCNVFRFISSDYLYSFINLSKLNNSFNEFAICWFIKEMTDIKVFRSFKINTFTTQGVEDIERYVRWCINPQTQAQLDKKLTDIYESQRDASNNCSMVDKNESYTVIDQALLIKALESLFPTIGLSNYPGTVNIELSDNLPYLLIEECDIEDSSIDKTTDGLSFKYSPEQDVSRSDTENSFLNNQIDVEEVVHSLVNSVCKHIGTEIDYSIPVRINDNFYIDYKSQGRIGAEKYDVQGNEEQGKQKEASGNASLTEVVCTQTKFTSDGPCKRIDIVECMKNGLTLTQCVPNLKETIASSRKSINCTLYLMGNPWNKFVSNVPESVDGTHHNSERAQQTMDKEKQTASQENAKYSRHIDSNQDPPNTLVHSHGELTSRKDSHNNELKSTENRGINYQSKTTTSFSLDDVNNAELSKKRKIGENDPISNSMHKKWKEDGYASNVFNVKNEGGDMSRGNRQLRGQHRVGHSSKKYAHDNSMKYILEKNDSCKRHSNKINWQDKGQFDHQSQSNDAKRSKHLHKSDHDYASRQRRKYDDDQKYTRKTDKSHRDYGRHSSRQHGSHRDDIRKPYESHRDDDRQYPTQHGIHRDDIRKPHESHRDDDRHSSRQHGSHRDDDRQYPTQHGSHRDDIRKPYESHRYDDRQYPTQHGIHRGDIRKPYESHRDDDRQYPRQHGSHRDDIRKPYESHRDDDGHSSTQHGSHRDDIRKPYEGHRDDDGHSSTQHGSHRDDIRKPYESHRDDDGHSSRQHGNHRDDIRKPYKYDERRERDYDGKRKAGDNRHETHNKQDDDNEMERIINRRNDNATMYTDNKGQVDEPRFHHRGRKRKLPKRNDLATDNENIRDLREIVVKKDKTKNN